MAIDREWQVRLQFLDEAGDYLSEIENCLLGCSDRGLDREAINLTLRAAHSIKGGAAMMGFAPLSDLAHRLEDALKVMQTGRFVADSALEQLFLDALTQMGRIALLHKQQQPIDASWLEIEIEPPFRQLYDRLGVPSDNDHALALSEEAGVDMRVMMFETEVDACLERLATVLADPNSLVLREEFLLASQEFGCLGEMLDLPAFVALCNQISGAIEHDLIPLPTLAPIAFQTWRKFQALIMVSQWDALPERLPIEIPSMKTITNEKETTSSLLSGDSNLTDSGFESEDLIGNLDIDIITEDQLYADDDVDRLVSEHISDLEILDISTDITEFISPDDIYDDLNEGIDYREQDQSNENISQDQNQNNDSFTYVGEIEQSQQQVEPEIDPISDSPESILNFDQLDELIGKTFVSKMDASALPETQSVRDELTTQAAKKTIKSTSEVLSSSPEATLRVPLRYLEQLSELFGDINAERNSLNVQLKSLQNLVTLLHNRVIGLEVSNQQLRNTYDLVIGANPRPLEGIPVGVPASLSNGKSSLSLLSDIPQNISYANNHDGVAADFDVLEMDRYNNLHLLARDIMDSVVQLQEVSSDMDTTLNEAESSARELGRVARQMQTNLERLRMRRLDEVLGHFPRVLRELSLRHGKSVQLVVRGGGTLVERSVLEQLNDPLLHLVRNAFDHGIETTEARLAAEKDPKGTIEIVAAYRGNQTTITLRDDGAGINLSKIREKAKLMGLSDREISQAGEEALLDLIFTPGFSTAETVTTLSGRGVGMDVVRTNLRRIGGDVTVKTLAGQGTTFILSVPVSLAIAQVLLVESNGFMMAVPVTAVEEMILLEQHNITELEGHQVLQWLDQDIPLINLADKFRFNRSQRFNSEENVPTVDRPVALVVRRGTEIFALGCDRYWTEVEATMRSVQGSLSLPHGFNGCAVVGGGRLIPLMDINKLLDWILIRESTAESVISKMHRDMQSKEILDRVPTVLTVDDSINVRRFLALILEKAGYRVEQAKDGQEALDKLHQGLAVDVVICDIEMPRLDGFGFLAQARNQAEFTDLPIIMLTSRSGAKHRNLAMNLGASDYFNKPFKEADLLETIANLTTKDLKAMPQVVAAQVL